VVATAALLWVRERRTFALLTVAIGILWLGLAETFSQSSYVALLAGLAVLAALRWSWKWTLAAVGVGAVGAVLVVLLVGGSGKVRLNIDTSGRANLVSGGVDLFAERPLWGYGSGSFQRAYRDHAENKDVPVSISHTEPVTVASEQGLIGLALYLGLIVVALWTLASGLFASRAGGVGRGGVEDDPARSAPPLPTTGPARQAVLAAFIALLAHTMAYAGFFEDPLTWVLLAVGASLAAAPVVRDAT
jgi:O-antigen ligase